MKFLTGSPAEGDLPAVAPTSICYALRNGVDSGLFSALKRQAVANGVACVPELALSPWSSAIFQTAMRLRIEAGVLALVQEPVELEAGAE